MSETAPPHEWLKPTPRGLYCEAGDFFVDPVQPVDRAVITHGHSDHARGGNGAVLATAETLAIMRQRFGDNAGGSLQALAYGETVRLGPVSVKLVPAGHILGSAQAVLEKGASRIVVSGDYKRRPDRTCAPFEPQPCDVFITEATFGLPVFRHPNDGDEIDRLLHSLRLFPERAHLVGTYALGKCQRVITLLRRQGYEEPIYLHGALQALCTLYEKFGVALGPLLPALGASKDELKGKIVLAPPSASAEPWARRLPDALVAQASGWMRVKQRAKAGGIELPLVISDHADWDELTGTIDELKPSEVWITHGAEEGLLRQAALMGYRARALSLIGFEDED
jgi:putative mRNA 3-end processing factor